MNSQLRRTNLNHNFHSETQSFDIYNEIVGLCAVYQNVSSDPDDGFELSDAGGTDYILSRIWEITNQQINDDKFVGELVEELDSAIIDSAQALHEIRSALVANWQEVTKYHEHIIVNKEQRYQVTSNAGACRCFSDLSLAVELYKSWVEDAELNYPDDDIFEFFHIHDQALEREITTEGV